MIVRVVKRNVKKKTDDLINVWQPPLPNNGEVRVNISVGDTTTFYFLDYYNLLNIEPFVERDGNKYYLTGMLVNGIYIICTPKLYLDKYIKVVALVYKEIIPDDVGLVLERLGDMSFRNYLPQFGDLSFYYSFPRTNIYKGIKFGEEILDGNMTAFPVDLDKEDFEVWKNGIKFTLHLNRDNKVEEDGVAYSLFDIIKAEFYGQLLPAEQIDDYIELKPKGD